MTAERPRPSIRRSTGSRWLSSRLPVPRRVNSLVAASGTIMATLFCAAALGHAGCTGNATCPGHRQMLDGSACNGADLQCEYENPVYACDGTIDIVASSCTCSGGKWSCPSPVESTCAPSTDTTAGGATGTDADGGTVMYPTTEDAGTSSSRQAPPLRMSSCPLVYVWNGSEFVYETDVGGLTLSLPPGATANQAIPLPNGGTFYHLLPRALHDSKKGLEILLRESVSEIAYFDEAKLILVDHPEGSEVWSSGDESTNQWGYVAPFKMYTGTAPRLPIQATDRGNLNVLPHLSKVDNWPAPVVAGTFDNEYVLDFGVLTAPKNAKLIIEGWSIYLYRAEKDIQPMVEAETADGSWVEVTRFGAPYGDYKAVAVDLSGKLPAGARKLRVTLGMEAGARWVIDRIRLDESEPVEVTMTTLEASTAELVHRGRATLNRPTLQTRQDALDDENPDEPVQQGYGAFTRFGDVRELLTDLDDKWVIMRHGDQITLKFPGAAAPPSGWTRSVVLKVDDAMKTFFYGNNVEPLPFHGMSQYPYPETESYPTDAAHRQYRDEYNTRIHSAP